MVLLQTQTLKQDRFLPIYLQWQEHYTTMLHVLILWRVGKRQTCSIKDRKEIPPTQSCNPTANTEATNVTDSWMDAYEAVLGLRTNPAVVCALEGEGNRGAANQRQATIACLSSEEPHHRMNSHHQSNPSNRVSKGYQINPASWKGCRANRNRWQHKQF